MMKNSLRVTGGLILTVLLALFLSACGGGGNGGETVTNYTISGTVTLPASVTTRYWYVIVDDDLDGGNGTIAETDGVFTGSTFKYSINNVPSGDYYVYAEVSLTKPFHNAQTGDYLGFFSCGTTPCKVTIDSSKTVDFTLVKYIKPPTTTNSR